MGIQDVCEQFKQATTGVVSCTGATMRYEGGGATQVFAFSVIKPGGAGATVIEASCGPTELDIAGAVADAAAQATAWAAS